MSKVTHDSSQRKSAQWLWQRRLTAAEQIKFACEAIVEHADVPLAFSVNLNPVFAECGLEWLRRRLVWHLEQVLRRPLDLVVVGVREAEAGRYHLHGALGIRRGERIADIRDALRAAGGPWQGRGSNYQVDTPRLINGGWATYIFNQHAICEPSMTNSLRRKAVLLAWERLVQERKMQSDKLTHQNHQYHRHTCAALAFSWNGDLDDIFQRAR